MSLRAKFWWTLAAVSVIVNGGGAIYALRRGEMMHGGIHMAALALTVYLIAIFRTRARRDADEAAWAADERVAASPGDDRVEQLQQSVDAIAVEVERIGEMQRYNAKLQATQSEGTGERR